MSPKALIRIDRVEKKRSDYLVHYSKIIDDDFESATILLDEEQIVSYRILKDKEFDQTTWKQIENEASQLVGYRKALSFINYQARTEHEIREYLKNHEITQDAIEIIVKRLKKANFIDDKRFAFTYVDNYLRNFKGPLYIKYRLQEKGVDGKIISQVIEGISEAVQKELILTVIEKEKGRFESYPIKRQKDLIMQKLLRDGFSGDIIIKCVSQVKWQSKHHDRLKNDYLKMIQKEQNQQKVIQKLMAKGYTYQEIKAFLDSQTNDSYDDDSFLYDN